ncbi:MAG: DUF1446 domain-containing protein [Firmicutes bacterium]|nr:DUF1446 domain-containing protein [Bacillota bacterium]
MSRRDFVRIGWGSAYADDNLDPAEDLARWGDLDALCFDALAERTLALAQIRREQNPEEGYDARLEEFARRFLPYAARGLTLVTNMGAANPRAAGRRLRAWARQQGLHALPIAVVEGDDVLAEVQSKDVWIEEIGAPLRALKGRVVSANAYLGADPVIQALREGARVVIGGRIADPSLGLAVMSHYFGWAADDWQRRGQGIVVGHLLECGSHVTGGNYADPPYRVVPGLDRLGMPWAEVGPDGAAVISKLPQAGGYVTENTVKAQLVYEIHDPARYYTPDVVADFTQVTVNAVGPDRVRVEGGTGTPAPATLKVLIGVDEGYQAEAEIGFAGPGAYDRARLCEDVLRSRYERWYRTACDDMRLDLIGVNATFGPAAPSPAAPPHEIRVRLAVATPDRDVAERITREVEWQYFGPAGGGGVRRRVTRRLAMYSAAIPRDAVTPRVVWPE